MAHTERRPTDRDQAKPPQQQVTKPATVDESRSLGSFLVANALDPAVAGAVGSAITIAAARLAGHKDSTSAEKPTASTSPPPADKSE
jgi:hypothetical protein